MKKEKNITFIHIPKTGGSSLIGIFKKNRIKIISHNIRDPNYKYLKEIKNKYPEFRFALVRNPWDRVVSAFFYLSNGGCNENDLKDAKKFNILKHKGNIDSFIREEFKTKQIFNQIHFKEQYKWICDDDPNILINYVGKFEKLPEEIESIKKKVKMNINSTEIPHKNKSKHEHYTKYYTPETIKIIEKAYKKDIELFNYTFKENY